MLEFLRPQGGSFAGEDAAGKDRWGDVELVFRDCTHATLQFFSAAAAVEGLMELRRLTPNVSCRDDIQ